jgi:hypothetical protein
MLFSMEDSSSERVPPSNEFFRPALLYLIASKDARWVHGAWFLESITGFFEHLSESDTDLILQNLVSAPRLGHQHERLLGLIAEHHLQAVWKYFGDRQTYEANKRDDDKYEAIPYGFDGLEKQLSQDVALAISFGRTWFDQDKELFQFRGGRLLSSVFPRCAETFAHALANLVTNGNETDSDFVLDVMQNYHEEPTTHEVLKRIVDRYPQDKSKLNQVKISFDQTGVVMGKFGMVEAYRAKKQSILTWSDDLRPAVRNFAEVHSAELNVRIASEQKRADERIEMRRREFNVGSDGNGEL